MKFFGVGRVFQERDDYSQMKEIGKFINQMEFKYPGEHFLFLGYNWTMDDKFTYVIGKMNEQPQFKEKVIEVNLPDENWEKYSCPFDSKEIENLYRSIWEQGELDYEIEEVIDGRFAVMVHRK